MFLFYNRIRTYIKSWIFIILRNIKDMKNKNIKGINEIYYTINTLSFLNFLSLYNYFEGETFSSFKFNCFLWEIKQFNTSIKIEFLNFKQLQPKKNAYYLRKRGLIIITISGFYFMPGIVVKALAVEKILKY